MADRLRFTGAAAHDPAVDGWFAERNDALAALARRWFEEMRDCGDDVRELVHDGCPVACVADVPFAYVNAFTKHVNVGFFNGAGLADPAALLEGAGKRMRHVKLKPSEPVNEPALRDLIAAAHADVRRFVQGGRPGSAGVSPAGPA